MEKEHLVDLLENKITGAFVEGMTNRQGKRFDARLKLDEEWKVKFYFGKEGLREEKARSIAEENQTSKDSE